MTCKNCSRLLKTTSATVTGGNLVLTVPVTNPVNLKGYCLVICQNIPPTAETSPVIITIGTTNYNVLCKKGNILRADQIKNRRKYKMYYGSDKPHFLICSEVRPTTYGTLTTEPEVPKK